MMKPLLKNERNVLINILRTMPNRSIFGFMTVIIIGAVFLYFVSRTIWFISPGITPEILEALLSYIFLFVLGFTILLGTPQVFKDLYTAKDLQLLFTMPIKTRHIFWLKLIKSFVQVPLFIVLLFIIPLWVYGVAIKLNLFFYPMVLIVLLAIAMIGLSIACLMNLILVQVIPAHRANEFVTVMTFFSGFFVYFLFISPSMRSEGDILETITTGFPTLPKLFPMTWGATAIAEVILGSWKFLLPFILLVILTIIFILLSTMLTERGFRYGWIRLNEGASRKKRKRENRKTITVRHPIIAIGKKEWYTIKRDMREWIVMMPIVVFFLFGLIGFFTSGDIQLATLREYSHISWPIGQAVFLFLFTLTNGSIAAHSIGREGPQAWILRVLPARGLHIALGKLWISWLFPLIIISALEVIFSLLLAWSLKLLVLGILMKALTTLGSSALGLWFGTMGAKYHPTNPQARLKFSLGILLFIFSYAYLILMIIPYLIVIIPPEFAQMGIDELKGNGIFYLIMYTFLKGITIKAHSPILVISLALLTILIISFAMTFIFTKLSARKIEQGITIQILDESRARPLFSPRRFK